MTEDNSTFPQQPHDQPATPAPGKDGGIPRADEVVSLLADFENSVDTLKKLCVSKPKATASSGHPIVSAAERLESERRQINELRENLESLRNDLTHRSTDLDQRAADIDRLRRELALELEQQRELANRLAEETRLRDAARDARDAALARKEEALASKLESLARESEALQKERSRLNLSTDSADSRLGHLEALQAGIDTKLREIERRELALEQRQSSGAMDARVAELNARLVDAQALAEAKSGELSAYRDQVQAAQGTIADLQRQLQTQQQNVQVVPPVVSDPQEVQARRRLEELLEATHRELDAAKAEIAEHAARARQLEASLDDLRRQTTRVTDTTVQLHEENDTLKRENESLRVTLDEAARASHLSQIEFTEQSRRLSTANATISDLETKLRERPDLDPIRAKIREELESELQAPIARAAQRADAAEAQSAAAQEELAAARARLAHESGQVAALESRLQESVGFVAERDELLARNAEEQIRLNAQITELEQKFRVERERALSVGQASVALDEELSDLRTRNASLERSLSEMREASLRHESAAQRAADELAVCRQRLSEAESSTHDLRTQIEFAGSRSEVDKHTIGSLEHDLAAARAHIELTRTEHAETQKTLVDLKARFENERVSLQTALGEVSAEREQIAQQHAAANAAIEEKNVQIEKLEASLKTASASANEAEQLRLESSRLTARLRDAMSVAEAAGARIRELETTVESDAEQIALLENRLSVASTSPPTPEGDNLRAKLELLKDRLRSEIEARDADAARIQELENALTKSRVISSDSLPPDRVKRLKLHRRLRRDQTSKLRNLGDALRSRFEICEQLIAQRAGLAAAQQLVNDAQRKIAAKQATSRVAVVGFFAAMTILILSFLSWAAAGQLFPGRYAARVTIEADGRGRDLPAIELQEWQKFHENLLTSPAFSDQVAEHMKRFGLMNMTTASSVAARLKEDMSFESPSPGQLIIELRGDGAARTTRELNAISTKFTSEAQELRNTRNDGAITSITKPAAALPDPIDQSRLWGALGLLGGSVSLSSIIAYLVYRKLVSAKTKFENEIALDALLDAKRWPDPVAGMEPTKKAA